MSLDSVVEDIRDETRARAEDIRQDGQEQTDEVVAEVEADAEELLESRKTDVEQQLEQEYEQAPSSAKLEAKQARLSARRDVLQHVRGQVEHELVELEGDRHEELTRSLLDATAVEFEDTGEVSVYGHANNEELLSSILEDCDGHEFAGGHDCLGGVVVEGSNSCVRVSNTFGSILDTVWEDNLKEVNTRLFDDR